MRNFLGVNGTSSYFDLVIQRHPSSSELEADSSIDLVYLRVKKNSHSFVNGE